MKSWRCPKCGAEIKIERKKIYVKMTYGEPLCDECLKKIEGLK